MKYIIILFSLLNITALNAQIDMDYTREALETKSKVELIQIAKNLLEEKYPEININLSDFNSRVWGNEFGTYKVVFNRVIRYAPIETDNVHYDITVNLNTKEILPFDDQDIVFYTPTEKADRTIQYLKKKGLLPKNIPLDIEYTITENEEYYLITCFDNLHHIDKNVPFNKEHPYLSKTLVNKETSEKLYFKARNPYYYLSLITFKAYYYDNLYTVLKEENALASKIIEIASSLLKEQQPDLTLNADDFEIVILGNYKDLIVKYRRFVRFEKSDKKYIYDLAVNLITKDIFPFNSPEDSFYVPSLSDEKAINTIQNTIALERNTNIEHTISENEDYFFITSLSEKRMKKYFIDKSNNEVVWLDESNNLPINNRDDLSLQEHYKTMNYSFTIKPENNKPLIDMALAILKEEQFIANFKLDDYSINAKASKNEVDICFARLVKFVPLRIKEKRTLEYNLNIDLVSKTIHQNAAQFYIHTKEDSISCELVKTKLIEYIEDFNPSYYPIEIIEEEDYFTINTLGVSNLDVDNRKQYRMDKKNKTITIFSSPSYFYPSPARMPVPFNEIKE